MNTKQIYSVKGMHCASCVSIIETALKKVRGVVSVTVNYGTEKASIVFDEKITNIRTISETLQPFGYSLVIDDNFTEHNDFHGSKNEKLEALRIMWNKIVSVIPIAFISIVIMSWDILVQFKFVPEMSFVWKEFFHHLLPVMATYVLFVVGKPYLLGLYRFLRYGKANMETLIGLGTFVAYIYSFIISAFEENLKPFLNVEQLYYDVTIVVVTFIALGQYLEARSKIKTGDAIEKLLRLQAKHALVMRDGKEIEIPVAQVMHGDLVIVKPGGAIPVDGILTEGSSYIDEAMVTGEPMPVSKKVGDNIVAGTVNTSGAFIFRATKIGAETLLARIIVMVEAAQGSKAPIQKLADTISGVFVPIVLVLAFLSFGIWLLLGTQYLGFSQALSYGLVSFVGILVIACPCALGLATPTAIIVGVGKGAREGILVKDAGTLEKLHKATMVIVDKTGTLTKGKPEIISFKNMSEKSDAELISLLASLERASEHPIAHAILTYAREKKIEFSNVTHFNAIKGMGVQGIIGDIEYYAGNPTLIKKLNISFDISALEKETREGKTPVVLATKEIVLAIVMVADAIKSEAREAVINLHALGIKVVMLTGDHINTAEYIGNQIGIDTVIANMMPEDKLNVIKKFQAEGNIVAMAGDGVNDAPALAQADVGIAMATGTDVAIESAGITLLHGDISKLVQAIRLSQITMRGITQNLFWAFFYNVVGIPLAGGLFYPLFGWLLSPVFAGLAMAFSSVSVVGNSLRLKGKKL